MSRCLRLLTRDNGSSTVGVSSASAPTLTTDADGATVKKTDVPPQSAAAGALPSASEALAELAIDELEPPITDSQGPALPRVGGSFIFVYMLTYFGFNLTM